MHVVDNAEDFHKYFSGTYIAHQKEGFLQPYIVRSSSGSTILLRPVGGEAPSQDITARFSDVINNYKVVPPRPGAVSTRLGVVYTTIVPERQYKKGLCDSRIIVHVFCRHLGDERLQNFVFHIFNNRLFELEELLEMLRAGERLGGAISPKMGIHLKPSLKYPVLTYKDFSIGSIEDQEVHLLEKFKVYEDYIRKTIPSKYKLVWLNKKEN